MPKAVQIVRKAAVRPDQVADTVSLDHAARNLDSGALTTESGLALELALGRAAILEDGDALKLDDGRLVSVRAAEEALLDIRAENPARLLRLAWQLGSHHVPAELTSDRLYTPQSAAELVRASGCAAVPVLRAFKPEKDLHDHSQCGHDHHHHEHGHDHGHGQHEHGPGCGHDHGRHDHGHDHHDHGSDHGHEHAPHRHEH